MFDRNTAITSGRNEHGNKLIAVEKVFFLGFFGIFVVTNFGIFNVKPISCEFWYLVTCTTYFLTVK